MAHKYVLQVVEEGVYILDRVELISLQVVLQHLQLPEMVSEELNVFLVVALLASVILLILGCYILLELADLLVDLLYHFIHPKSPHPHFFKCTSLSSLVLLPFLHSKMYFVFSYF